MMRSLFSGVSGLKTHQTKMDVIGNNISNVNTVAFKSSSTSFSDIMYQTTSQASGATATRGGTNAKQIGLGVTNGATKISITSSGAAQSTGDALDIRLTDTNTTNFFIVSNGTENLFTRAGSFYVDGNGNLAMTTTGYLVMGWQVSPQTGEIVKDTVSALRVMQAANKTSPPEATTQATFSGVVDQNDVNVKDASTGYIRSLTFYDSLGYSYTAKFSIKVQDAEKGDYTIELTNIYDSSTPANDILQKYLNVKDENGDYVNKAEDIFGKYRTYTKTYGLASGFTRTDGGQLTYTDGTDTYTYKTDAILAGADAGKLKFVTADGTKEQIFSINTIFGVAKEDYDNRMTDADGNDTTVFSTVKNGATVTNATLTNILADGNPSIVLTYETTDAAIKFDTKDGKLVTVGSDGGKTLQLNASLLGPNLQPTPEENAALEDITIDFSQLLNYENGGTSTVVAARGGTDGTTGAGKKLGTMTGLSIDGTGRIYGSYSNGNTTLLGQIAVAQFANASGLEEMGNNCYNTTLNSGEFDGIGVDVSADGSSMATGQLEMSNVDLSGEFTEMIVTQRGFQANSRIITVSDTLLEELINLKR